MTEHIKSRRGVKILQIDAKDLYIAGIINGNYGFNFHTKTGDVNLKKFISDVPYSLELIELRKIYESVYGNRKFTTFIDGKNYCKYVVSVTFKYSVKEWNRVRSKTYVKLGYDVSKMDFKDGIAYDSGEIVGIVVEENFDNLLEQDALPMCFKVDEGQYKAKTSIKTVLTVAELREKLYENGFNIEGTHYVRYKRSAGSARVGKCNFIAEPLYKPIMEWSYCGLAIEEGMPIDLAGFETYLSLTMSSIIDTIEIPPESILLIDDYDSVFTDLCANVTEVDGKLKVEEANVDIANSIWDGQSLIDINAMGAYSDVGFILLRNKFFKSAAFNFNLQQFFKDHGITSVSQLNGITRAKRIEDVRLITTPSSVKYLKYGSFDEWLDNAEPLYGIVKTEHESEFFNGRLTPCHYQLLNSLQISYEEMKEFLKPTLDYLTLIKTDPAAMRTHIKYCVQDYSDGDADKFTARDKNEIFYKLLGINDKFAKTKTYGRFKDKTVQSFTNEIKNGHVPVWGSYCTMVGNPIEMAMYSIGKFDGTPVLKQNEVYCTRFEFGNEYVGTRSPHVAQGNVFIAKNTYNELVERYCNLTDNIVVVNSIEYNLLNRLSGCDFDSDSLLIINNDVLLKCAKKNYDKFLVPTNSVHAIKKETRYTNHDKYIVDESVNNSLIGICCNLAQALNSMYWDKINNGANESDVKDIYLDAAVLDVISNLAIDSAKRKFNVNLSREIEDIRKKYKSVDKKGRSIKPKFFGHVARSKGYYDNKRNNYKTHDTAMDYLQKIVAGYGATHARTVVKNAPFSSMLVGYSDNASVDFDSVYNIIKQVRWLKDECKRIYSISNDVMSRSDKHEFASKIKTQIIEYVDDIVLSKDTMRYLLEKIEDDANKDIQMLLLDTLFACGNSSFYNIVMSSKEDVYKLEEVDDGGDVSIYGINYSHVKI